MEKVLREVLRDRMKKVLSLVLRDRMTGGDILDASTQWGRRIMRVAAPTLPRRVEQIYPFLEAQEEVADKTNKL